MVDEVPELSVGVLRELLRNLQAWESLFEITHCATLTGPDGVEYHIDDIKYLYSCRVMLSARQRQAIELCLYQDTKEKDAALLMGVSPTNPVAMYATNGLNQLLKLVQAGMLPRYRHDHHSGSPEPVPEEHSDQEGAA